MKRLERMELVTATDTGGWQVRPDAFENLQAMDDRERLSADLHAAMERAGISRPIRLGDERSADEADVEDDTYTKRIIGRVIGKSLAS